jgi:hypothetical protein
MHLSDFSPSSFIFKPEQAGQIVWSDFGLAITLSLLGAFTYFRGWKEMVIIYLIPYLFVNQSVGNSCARSTLTAAAGSS